MIEESLKIWWPIQKVLVEPNGTDSPLDGGDSPLDYSGGFCDPADSYEYAIITNNALKDTTGYTYNWSDLIDHRQSYSGLAGTIVTVEEIDACVDYWNDTALFNDSQAHIREFCKDAYEDWGMEYILLGGDWDATASHQIIPYRLWPVICIIVILMAIGITRILVGCGVAVKVVESMIHMENCILVE
jgi:hypothetical protein